MNLIELVGNLKTRGGFSGFMGRAELGIEGVQGEEGAGNGVGRGDFRDLLRRIKPGAPECQESRHFSQ